MKQITLSLLFCIFCINFSSAQSYKELVAEAWKLYEKKSYKASKEKYAQAFKLEKTNASDWYNGACSAALSGDKKMALKMVKNSVKNGWSNVSHMNSDSDLDLIHKAGKWKKITAIAQKNLDIKEANYNKPLQAELLAIHKEDQETRHELMAMAKEHGWGTPPVDSLSKIIQQKDEVNLAKIEKIIAEHGWVGPKLVGNQASSTVFLVIQHSDLEVQKKYYSLAKEAVEKGNLRGSSFALLEDRIALREGRKQTYGSQIGSHPDTKKPYVLPLEDPDNVDARRATVGLGPLGNYTNHFDFEWDVAAYKEMLPEYEAIEMKNREKKKE